LRCVIDAGRHAAAEFVNLGRMTKAIQLCVIHVALTDDLFV